MTPTPAATLCVCASRPRAVAALSPADVDTLQILRAAVLALRDGPCPDAARIALDRQNAWLAAASAYGYTFEALGRVIGLSRQRAQKLAATAPPDVPDVPPVAGVPAPPPVDLPWPSTDTPGWRRRPRPTLSVDEAFRLRDLHKLASGLRGNVPADHPKRVASERLSAILAELVDDPGFTYGELAAVLGVGKGTIRSRLKAHGYRGGPAPSQPRYAANPPPGGKGNRP